MKKRLINALVMASACFTSFGLTAAAAASFDDADTQRIKIEELQKKIQNISLLMSKIKSGLQFMNRPNGDAIMIAREIVQDAFNNGYPTYARDLLALVMLPNNKFSLDAWADVVSGSNGVLQQRLDEFYKKFLEKLNYDKEWREIALKTEIAWQAYPWQAYRWRKSW